MTNTGFTIRDRSDELTTTTLNTPTPASFTLINSAVSALFNGGLVLGLPTKTRIVQENLLGLAGPIGAGAQRELKWSVTYEDVQQFLDPGTDLVPNPGFGKFYSFEIGAANPDLLQFGTDILQPTDTGYSLITDLINDLSVRSPTGGTIEVRRVRLVGRNI